MDGASERHKTHENLTVPDHVRLIAALCVASFLAALNFFATAPFFLEIARDLNTRASPLGQVTTAIMPISTVLGLGLGSNADCSGFRLPSVPGVVAVVVTLDRVSLAQSYSMLLALNISGGVTGALVLGLLLAIAGVDRNCRRS